MSKTYVEIIRDEVQASGWTCTDTARSDKQGNEFFVVTAEKDGRKCVSEAETLMTAYIELQPMLSKVEAKGQ